MIQPQTLLNVADNSGAQNLMCIRVIGAAGNQRHARIGDVIVAVIKDALPQMPLERSEVIRAVIVLTCKEFKCEDGIIIRYDDNVAVIMYLMRIDSFRMEDRKHIWDTLEKHLPIDLLKNKLSF
ncbi:hypothetical protein ZWY2020_024107 [Hordeum vulgare]|nr:hypothetical protein ZWY2020_024107 [Hordeum vulgare]